MGSPLFAPKQSYSIWIPFALALGMDRSSAPRDAAVKRSRRVRGLRNGEVGGDLRAQLGQVVLEHLSHARTPGGVGVRVARELDVGDVGRLVFEDARVERERRGRA